MKILSIDTSADETSVAITDGRKVLSNVIYSQALIHTKWGGIYPSIAKRAHEERIDWVVSESLKRLRSQYSKAVTSNVERKKPTSLPLNETGIVTLRPSTLDKSMNKIDYIAVTQGPGLAVALEVGIKKAKELVQKYNKKLIAVNHLEGHIYSSFVQNSRGNPKRDFNFPYLALVISGGHTEIVLWKDHLEYKILGETRDDAAGEALDKAAKMLGLGYPGGPIIERLAREVDNKDFHNFPRPMTKSKNLEFSFSGLKTSFFYFLRSSVIATPPKAGEAIPFEITTVAALPRNGNNSSEVKTKIRELASSFQEAVFDTLIKKTDLAIKQTGINRLVIGGGVIANLYLRKLFRNLVEKYKGEIYFPPYNYLTGDNAAMIGIVAHYKAEKGLFVSDLNKLDRIPRWTLNIFY